MLAAVKRMLTDGLDALAQGDAGQTLEAGEGIIVDGRHGAIGNDDVVSLLSVDKQMGCDCQRVGRGVGKCDAAPGSDVLNPDLGKAGAAFKGIFPDAVDRWRYRDGPHAGTSPEGVIVDGLNAIGGTVDSDAIGDGDGIIVAHIS